MPVLSAGERLVRSPGVGSAISVRRGQTAAGARLRFNGGARGFGVRGQPGSASMAALSEKH
jgi:hypothetical protein